MTKLEMIVCLLVLFVPSSHQAGQQPVPRRHAACNTRRDCQDIQQCLPQVRTGIYTIYPKGSNGIRVRCDMDTAGGGWTVIQRRISHSDFYKTWNEYQTGFGNLNTNFWLGNYQIHLLTAQSWYELRIDMTGPTGHERYAHYDLFALADGFNKYRLLIGKYNGNAGNSLGAHNGYAFSTKDADNDIHAQSCAVRFTGGWWYSNCHSSNLNGQYGNKNYGKGINWHAFTTYKKSLIKVDMKIRRHPRQHVFP